MTTTTTYIDPFDDAPRVWQVTRFCCTSGMCVTCHENGRTRTRILHADKLTETTAIAMEQGWRAYGAQRSLMPGQEGAAPAAPSRPVPRELDRLAKSARTLLVALGRLQEHYDSALLGAAIGHVAHAADELRHAATVAKATAAREPR